MDGNSSGKQNALDGGLGGLFGLLGGPGAMAGGLTGALAGHSMGGGAPALPGGPTPIASPEGQTALLGPNNLTAALGAINAMPAGAGAAPAAAKAGGMGAMMSKASPYIEAAKVLGTLLAKKPDQVVTGGGSVAPL